MAAAPDEITIQNKSHRSMREAFWEAQRNYNFATSYASFPFTSRLFLKQEPLKQQAFCLDLLPPFSYRYGPKQLLKKKKKMKNSPRQISTRTHGWPMAKNGNWVLEGTLRMESIFQSLTFQTNTATHTGKCPSHTEEEEDKDHLAGCHYKNLNEADNRKLSTNTPVMVCVGLYHSNHLTISPRQKTGPRTKKRAGDLRE